MKPLLVWLTATFALTALAVRTPLAFGAPQSSNVPQTPNRVAAATQTPSSAVPPERALLDRYCVGCHNPRLKSGDLVLAGLDVAHVGNEPETWERVVRKLRGGLMPPAGRPRPDEATYKAFLSTLQTQLDTASLAHPDPGRTEIVHRLNRLEYANTVRDLLSLDINAPDLLPADDSSYGFDNIAGVLKMSPALMERYLAAAKIVSRSAVGSPPPAMATAIYRVPPETQQHDRHEELPFGTRGGTLIRHVFPLNAEYEVRVGISNGRGASDPQQLELTIDGAQVKLFAVAARSSGTSSR